MRPLADPASLAPGILSLLFVATVTVALPLLVMSQERRLTSMQAAGFVLGRGHVYVGAVTTHALLLAGAWLAAREAGIILFPDASVTGRGVLVGLAALGLGLIPLVERWSPGGDARARTELIAPRTTGETAAFTGVSVSAGIAEEIAYRGVLFLLLAHYLDGWWVPALLAAAAFGVAHLFQGWRAAGLAGLMGLVAQVVVGLTGTLLVAIGVHIVHDVVAGVVIGRRARRSPPGGNPVAV